jgi:pilus assembly protein Flp/PilA
MSKLTNWATKKYIEYKTRDEEGQGLAEYGLILALVAVAAIAALGFLGDGIVGSLETVTDSLGGGD